MKTPNKENIDIMLSKTKRYVDSSLNTKQDKLTAGTGLELNGTTFNMTGAIPYTTSEPQAPNYDGIKIVVLNYEPATRYDGYWYIITESQS